MLSLLFSFISTNAINHLTLIPAIIVLFIVIAIGVLADVIGIAVTVGNEEDFHAKASKKIEGAKTSIKLIRNSATVSNFCCDVIGDICGVLSGAISAMIALKITDILNVTVNVNFLISAVVAAVTVGTKAVGKIVAQVNSTNIVHVVGTVFRKFIK